MRGKGIKNASNIETATTKIQLNFFRHLNLFEMCLPFGKVFFATVFGPFN